MTSAAKARVAQKSASNNDRMSKKQRSLIFFVRIFRETIAVYEHETSFLVPFNCVSVLTERPLCPLHVALLRNSRNFLRVCVQRDKQTTHISHEKNARVCWVKHLYKSCPRSPKGGFPPPPFILVFWVPVVCCYARIVSTNERGGKKECTVLSSVKSCVRHWHDSNSSNSSSECVERRNRLRDTWHTSQMLK